jgi:hypothetical protein
MRRAALALVPALLGPLASPASAANAVVARCNYQLTGIPDSTQVLLVLVAEAHATPPAPVLTTTVSCRLTLGTTNPVTITATGSSIGPAVVASASAVVRPATPITVCFDGTATWLVPGPPVGSATASSGTSCSTT